MLSHEDNMLLCRVEGTATMGQMMRRYWVPATQSANLVAGGEPKRVRLFGENLVAFRGSDGRVGLVDEYCPHRGASLALARNEDCALTCLYHGWRVAADGRLMATPTEPDDSSFKDRIRHIAYPVRESGGLVWAYLGPAEHMPEPPTYEWSDLPTDQIMFIQVRQECNWAQCLEGAIDSAHSNYLHQSQIVGEAAIKNTDGESNYQRDGILGRPSNDGKPKIEIENTDFGFRYAAIRRPINEPDKYRYVRTSLFIAPIFAMFPAPKRWGHMQAFVPMDDTHTMMYYIRYKVDGQPISDEERESHLKRAGARMGIDIHEDFTKTRGAWNNWLQDREAMANGDFTGILGVQNQDMAVQESMGPIFDRTREHLATTDVAVIRMRRLMLDSARRFAGGEQPLGLRTPVAHRELTVIEAMIGIDDSWRSLHPAGIASGHE